MKLESTKASVAALLAMCAAAIRGPRLSASVPDEQRAGARRSALLGPWSIQLGRIVVRDTIASGKYRVFYKYLEGRYADTVVLTFRQIEDLLGFALPAPARTDAGWWTNAPAEMGEPRECSEAWILAHRTARADVAAQHVVFERVE